MSSEAPEEQKEGPILTGRAGASSMGIGGETGVEPVLASEAMFAAVPYPGVPGAVERNLARRILSELENFH